MLLRPPNNPIVSTLDMAVTADLSGEYLAEPKADGWRSPLYLEEDKFVRHSKYQDGPQAKTMPPGHLMEQLNALKFPAGTAFDAEWMGPRAVKHTGGAHWFVLLDLLYYGGQWQGDVPYEQRKENLKTLFLLHSNKHGATPLIQLMPHQTTWFLDMYIQQKKLNGLTEGIVVKKRTSTLVPSGGDNPGWMKIKYRQ